MALKRSRRTWWQIRCKDENKSRMTYSPAPSPDANWSRENKETIWGGRRVLDELAEIWYYFWCVKRFQKTRTKRLYIPNAYDNILVPSLSKRKWQSILHRECARECLKWLSGPMTFLLWSGHTMGWKFCPVAVAGTETALTLTLVKFSQRPQ
jgi:hypothetical protein